MMPELEAAFHEFLATALGIMGLLLMVAGAGLWLQAGRDRFERRNPYGVMTFDSYGLALAFHLGNWLKRVGGLLLLALGGCVVVLATGQIAALHRALP